jgi:hypothetical protein
MLGEHLVKHNFYTNLAFSPNELQNIYLEHNIQAFKVRCLTFNDTSNDATVHCYSLCFCLTAYILKQKYSNKQLI